jgi:tetratricopeptide (TPR) repeat protein
MLKKNSLLQKILLVLFGLCLAIVILEIGLRLGGSVILYIQEYRNQQAIKKQGSFRIICLGESTTQGQYPPYLEKILNQNSPKIKFSVIDNGLAGIKTAEILSQLEVNLDKYQPNMVVAMMGINDYGSHLPFEADRPSKSAIILRSFKVYKLSRLLWLRLATKLKEIKSKRVHQDIPKDKLKQVEEFSGGEVFEYREVGNLYSDQARSAELEQLCKKSIEFKPDDDSVYLQLGWFYKDRFRFLEAEQLFKKAAEIKPDKDAAYIELGRLYQSQGKLAEAEQAFKKAIVLNPNNSFTLNELGTLYSSQGRFAEAEQLFRKAAEFNPGDERLYGKLALIYSEIGNNELFKAYAEKANSLRNGYYDFTTADNYYKLKQILDKRRIKLVCVEYPMLNIKPLKKIFEKEAQGGIVFVDNEEIFKDAVRKEGYKEYFIDMFGGDFGHCTKKGNELLARNIANAILKEVLDKK